MNFAGHSATVRLLQQRSASNEPISALGVNASGLIAHVHHMAVQCMHVTSVQARTSNQSRSITHDLFILYLHYCATRLLHA